VVFGAEALDFPSAVAWDESVVELEKEKKLMAMRNSTSLGFQNLPKHRPEPAE
jgi:hypothetical protein